MSLRLSKLHVKIHIGISQQRAAFKVVVRAKWISFVSWTWRIFGKITDKNGSKLFAELTDGLGPKDSFINKD